MTNKKMLKTIFGTDNALSVIPGTVLAFAVMLLSLFAASHLGNFIKVQWNLARSPVSAFLLAIILGMIVRNIFKLPSIFEPGIKFCVAKLLRLGIMFLGIRLSILAVAKIGAVAVLVVVVCIASGILISQVLAKLFGVSDRLGTLIAAGTGICGVSAIVATSPAIGAKEEETAYAVSIITIFGLIATIIYPYMIELLLKLNLAQAGIFLGTAIHDTAQVTGAAYIYDQLWAKEVSKIAITTKLVRNTFMIAVIPICSIIYAVKQKNSGNFESKKIHIMKYFPFFVLGFLAFAIFRSLGDFFVSSRAGRFLFWDSSGSWSNLCSAIKAAAQYVLAIAIAGAGLSTQFSKLKKLSFKPFIIGLMAAVTVGLVSYLLISILNGPISSLISGR